MMNKVIVPYKEKVSQALGAWTLSGGTSDFKVLTLLLGYPFMGEMAEFVPRDNQADEDVVQQAWLSVFRQHIPDANMSMGWLIERHLMVGLLFNNRWHAVFNNEGTAREFVSILARYFWDGAFQGSDLEGNSFWIHLQAAMPEWIPKVVPQGVHAADILARAFFHETWVTLVFNSRRKGEALETLIRATQPEFLPGRLTCGQHQSAAALPALDFGSV
jgi:hypothetical protein